MKNTHDGAVDFAENHVILACAILVGEFFGCSLSSFLQVVSFWGGGVLNVGWGNSTVGKD